MKCLVHLRYALMADNIWSECGCFYNGSSSEYYSVVIYYYSWVDLLLNSHDMISRSSIKSRYYFSNLGQPEGVEVWRHADSHLYPAHLYQIISQQGPHPDKVSIFCGGLPKVQVVWTISHGRRIVYCFIDLQAHVEYSSLGNVLEVIEFILWKCSICATYWQYLKLVSNGSLCYNGLITQVLPVNVFIIFAPLMVASKYVRSYLGSPVGRQQPELQFGTSGTLEVIAPVTDYCYLLWYVHQFYFSLDLGVICITFIQYSVQLYLLWWHFFIFI